MRLNNELTLNNTIKNNVENSKSFVEMQDSTLKTVGDILSKWITLRPSITHPVPWIQTESNLCRAIQRAPDTTWEYDV